MFKYVAMLISCHLLTCHASGGGFHNIIKKDDSERKSTTSGNTAGTQAQPQPKVDEQKTTEKK